MCAFYCDIQLKKSFFSGDGHLLPISKQKLKLDWAIKAIIRSSFQYIFLFNIEHNSPGTITTRRFMTADMMRHITG